MIIKDMNTSVLPKKSDHSLLLSQGGWVPLSADLHCHSSFSDGVLSPETLAARAFERGVDLWALTDHDEVSGIAAAQQAAKQHGMAFLAGAEISVTWLGRTVHIVGLGLDAENATLLAGLRLAILQGSKFLRIT